MKDNETYYEARLDRIFGKGTAWQHRTLRTVFDPYSAEWAKTDYDRKIEILEKAIASGENLEILILEYKARYIEQNRNDISKVVEDAVIKLLEYKISVSNNSSKA